MKKFDNKFLKKLEKYDRFTIIIVILAIMMAVLTLKLMHLTLIKGNYYRDIAKNNRLREVKIPAPRGNIYDRNGELLATTKNVYVANLYKDQIKQMKLDDSNDALLNLSRILEKDGSMNTEDFPIALNAFTYRNTDDYLKEDKSPLDKVASIVMDKNIMANLIDKTYSQETNQGIYKKTVLDYCLNALRSKGLTLKLDRKDNKKFDTNDKETVKLLKKHGLKETSDVNSAIATIIQKDKSIIRKLLNDSVIRSMVYKELEKENLQDNIVLKDMELKDNQKLLEKKVEMMKLSNKIDFKTEAADDFVNIVKDNTIVELLKKVDVEDDKKTIMLEKALNLLKKNGIQTNVEFSLDEKDKQNPKVKAKFVTESKKSTDPYKHVADLLNSNNLSYKFITDDDIKLIAQSVNTENNINPSISVNDWKYIYQKNMEDFYKSYDKEINSDVKLLYEEILKKNKCEKYSKYDAYNIVSIYNQLKNKGQKGYEPIALSYNLTEESVSSIEEKFGKNQGIEVATRPVRYYPNGEELSHVLGYIGKISTEKEIEEYVKQKGYSKDSLIGKTGIEESKEDALKGQDGSLRVMVDSKGNRTETLSEKKAIPGDNVYLSIDTNVQRVAEESLKKSIKAVSTGGTYVSEWGDKTLAGYKNAKSGAAVAVDVETGEILAMASFPSYNPNLFSTGISQTDWESLQAEDPKDPISPRPLYNIPMQAAMQPGSIFKLNTSLAALEGGFDPYHEIKCGGYVDVGGSIFGCWIWNEHKGTHGSDNVMKALRDSCNYYFYSLALGKDQRRSKDLGYQLSIDELVSTARKLGLGSKTGIDINIPAENSGTVPDPQIKENNFKAIFRRFLEKNAEKYVKEGEVFTPKEMKSKIDKIVLLADDKNLQTRTNIIKTLDSLGFDPEKKLDGERNSFSDKIKFDYLNQSKWNIGDMLNVVIGQGQNAYTPLQMARYISAFANNGYLNKLSLVNEIKSNDNSTSLFKNAKKSERIKLKNYENLEYIRKGLHLATTEGYEKNTFRNFPVSAGVKTGTAQVGVNPVTGETYDNHAWMIGFAPVENPKVAVVTVIMQGGTSTNNGPMTRDIMAEALKLKHDKDKKQENTESENDMYENSTR